MTGRRRVLGDAETGRLFVGSQEAVEQSKAKPSTVLAGLGWNCVYRDTDAEGVK